MRIRLPLPRALLGGGARQRVAGKQPANQLELPLAGPATLLAPAPAGLEGQVAARVRAVWDELASRRPKLGSPPRLAFDLSGRSAGQYVWYSRRGALQDECLRFNLHLAARHERDFLAETVAHEVAHCAAVRLHRHGGHGAPWQALMKELGLAPTRCHDYDTRGARGRGHWPARCDCREHDLSSVLRNRLRRGWRYLCSRCGGRIVLLDPGAAVGLDG